jgi:hypothetical protein
MMNDSDIGGESQASEVLLEHNKDFKVVDRYSSTRRISEVPWLSVAEVKAKF